MLFVKKRPLLYYKLYLILCTKIVTPLYINYFIFSFIWLVLLSITSIVVIIIIVIIKQHSVQYIVTLNRYKHKGDPGLVLKLFCSIQTYMK